jgi:hypothetical protein
MHLTEADGEDMSRIVWDGEKTQQRTSVVIHKNLRFNNKGIKHERNIYWLIPVTTTVNTLHCVI